MSASLNRIRNLEHLKPTAYQKCPVACDLSTVPLIKEFPESINHYANEGS
jgi:hypothetical protein